jgi:hypothetical protein
MNIFSTSFNYKGRLEKVRKLMETTSLCHSEVTCHESPYFLRTTPCVGWAPSSV